MTMTVVEDESTELGVQGGPFGSSGPSRPTLFQIPNPGDFFSLVTLLNQPLNERVFEPTKYLGASHEVFGFTLIVTWIITLIYRPEQIFNHPARSIIGSFNPCFGWDYPPASYIALVCCSVNVFLTWRYVWLERTRTRLRNPGKLTWYERFASFTTLWLAFASNCWLLLWVLGPASTGMLETGPLMPASDSDLPSWFFHTGLFVFYASGSYLACLGNYLESRLGGPLGEIKRKHTIFIGVYGFAVAFLTAVYSFSIWKYRQGQPPALPPYVTQSADILWCASHFPPCSPPAHPLLYFLTRVRRLRIVSVACVTSFTAPESPLKMTMTVVGEEGSTDAAPLLSSAAWRARSEVARDEAEETAIRSSAFGGLWGDFDVDVLGQPPVGMDALSSWPSVFFFWIGYISSKQS